MSERFKKIKGKICTEIFVLFLAALNLIVAVSVFPLLLFTAILYRSFVVFIAKNWRPELTHTLKTQSYLALENRTRGGKLNVVGCLIFEGDISQHLKEIQSLFTSRVLDKTEKGELVYPELRQIWTSFMGYFFWKNETNFQIGEHIKICDYEWNDGFKMPEVCTQKDLKQLATRLVSESWKKDFSPWEFLIIPNYSDDDDEHHDNAENMASDGLENKKSALIVRYNHSMGDGKGWFNILFNDLFQCKDHLFPQMTKREKPKWWRNLLLPIKMPYDLVKNILESYDPSRNPWHTPEKRAKKYYTSISSPIYVQRIKDLKIKFGMSYAAILTTAISGGIRQIMKQAGQSVPKKMKVAMVLPLPNHPGNICIHTTIINLSWPTGVENGISRLEEIWRDMESKRNSLYPFCVHLMLGFGYMFPNFVLRMVYNQGLPTFIASFFPGPMFFPTFLGHSVVDSFSLIGLPSGQFGASISSSVIGGKQRIAVSIDKTLYPSQDTFEKLGGFIEEELRALEAATAEFSSYKKAQNIV